jgi:hypothetical protein
MAANQPDAREDGVMARDIFMDDWLSRLLIRMNTVTLFRSFIPLLDRPLFKLAFRLMRLGRWAPRMRS